MTPTPQDVQAKLDAATAALQTALTTIQAAHDEAGQLLAPTPPPPAPPPAGTILTDIEPTAYPFSWGIQAGNKGTSDAMHTGTVWELAPDPAGGAAQYAHIHLPANTATGRAAEGLQKRSIDLGVTDYYGVQIYLPADWASRPQNPSWHTVCLQCNYGSLGGPPVSLIVQPTTLELMLLTGHVAADTSGNATGYEFQSSPNAGTRLILSSPAPVARWIDVIVEVKWATTAAGFVNGWTHQPGGAWLQTVDSQKTFGKLVPTQQWGNVEGHNVNVAGVDAATGKPYVTADKVGLYAGPSSAPADIWHKRLVRGTSFDSVAAKLT